MPSRSQRWTVRVQTPSRRAASPGPTALFMHANVAFVVLSVNPPRRLALLEECAQALLALGARPLAGDAARRMPARRLVRQAAHLAHDRLRGTRGGRAGREQVGDRQFDRRVERRFAFDDLVDEPDAQRPRRVEPRPPGNSARAWVSPILAITNGLITAGRMPRRVSVKPNLAPASAMTRSLTAHRPIPPPSAAPWTRAITGTGQRSMASNISAIAIASCSFCSRVRPRLARIQVTSAPAQNDGPSPARTTARSCSAGSSDSAPELAAQLADQLGVEGVVNLGPVERHAGDHAVGPPRSTRIESVMPAH